MVNLANKKLRLRKDEMMKKLILTLVFSNTLLFGNNTFFGDFSYLDWNRISAVFDDRNFAQVGKEICKEKRWFPTSYGGGASTSFSFRNQVSVCLYLGLTKANSDKEKFELVKKACDYSYGSYDSEVVACIKTAEFYKNGIGTARNESKAQEYGRMALDDVTKSCEKEINDKLNGYFAEPSECFALAYAYDKGIGTSKSFQKATEIYRQICQVFKDEKACRKQ